MVKVDVAVKKSVGVMNIVGVFVGAGVFVIVGVGVVVAEVGAVGPEPQAIGKIAKGDRSKRAKAIR